MSAYLEDLDGDGWEDITLVFHRCIYTVSSRTGQVLSNFQYDVAAAAEPASPKWFHSGRNYGTYSPGLSRESGMLETVQVGGAAIGSFDDAIANVSRFVAVIDSVPGAPLTRRLKWSKFYGYAATTFAVIDPKLAADPPVLRRADLVNGAIHRFSDSRAVVNGREAVILNYFRQAAVTDGCLTAQYKVYLPPPFAPETYDAWLKCLRKNLKNPGIWTVQVLAQSDGTLLIETPNVYVWGVVADVLPGQGTMYVTEDLSGTMPYDLSDRPPGTLKLRSLSRAGWGKAEPFPLPGRPKITSVERSRGAVGNSQSPIAELTLHDLDGDGLQELQLLDGTWIGYDAHAKGLVAKRHR
jgi:hypothetical protein